VSVEERKSNEKPAKHYNKIFHDKLVRGDMPDNPSASGYAAGWRIVLRWLRNDERILDLGCGCGLFGKLALNKGKNYVRGIDFSRVAIKRARQINPKHVDCFKVADFFSLHTKDYEDFDVVIILEALEHVVNDLKLLETMPEGIRVILSVPSFGKGYHVRVFPTLGSAIQRYEPLLEIKQAASRIRRMSKFKFWFIDGLRRKIESRT